jgi:hypothetical protein
MKAIEDTGIFANIILNMYWIKLSLFYEYVLINKF